MGQNRPYTGRVLISPATLTPDFERLLAMAMYPDPARVAAQLDDYWTDQARRVFGWQIDGQLVAAVGLRVDRASATIWHIGTDPAWRRRGYARQLLHAVEETLDADQLVAETDEDAVGFYRRIGFEIWPQGERFGRRRYRCVWRRP